MFEGKLSGLRQLLATEIPSKILKYAFYFTLKALFVLKVLKYFSTFRSCKKNSFIRNIRLIPNLMTSQPL